jgi:hypothetical protein
MKIVKILESTRPIRSDIRNAYIDFSKMTLSVVAVVTDVIREGRPVVGYGFNSNGRYGQGGLIRERFVPRLLEADPQSLVDDAGENLDPHRIWARMMTNEKPGGHGERSVAEPVLDAGCTQPRSLWRHAPGPRLAAIRLRLELRAGGVPTHARHAAAIWLVAVAVRPARRASDVARHCCRPRTRRQRIVS